MKSYLFLPFAFLKFWYIEAPTSILGYFQSLNKAFLQLFSLTLLVKTFFQPLKNEYREGLVGFSRAIGMIVKFFLIAADTLIFTILLFIEVSVFLSFIAFPLLTVWILFL